MALVAAVVLGACSSSGSSGSSSSSSPPSTSPGSAKTDADVAETMEQLKGEGVSGAIRGTVSVGGRTAPIRGRFSGTELATNGRGTLTGVAPLLPRAPLDVAWRDGALASKRTPGVAMSVWPSPLVVQSAAKPLPPVAPLGVFTTSVELVFPPALLARIQNLKPDQDEKTEVDGSSARRVTFSYVDRIFNRVNRVTLTFAAGPRLARVRVQSELGELRSVLDYRLTLGKDGPVDVELPAATTDPTAAPSPDGTVRRAACRLGARRRMAGPAGPRGGRASSAGGSRRRCPSRWRHRTSRTRAASPRARPRTLAPIRSSSC